MPYDNDTPPMGRGTVIGREWVVATAIGQGGAGYVLRCRNKNTGVVAALKFLAMPDGSHRAREYDRFLRERWVMERMDHVHIVKMFSYGMHTDENGRQRPFMALEFVAGGSLDAYLRRNGPTTEDVAAWIMVHVCRGMIAARGGATGGSVVHRDLKPDNLLIKAGPNQEPSDPVFIVGDDREGAIAKIADFGLAKVSTDVPKISLTGQVMGTPNYMSPEQCRDSTEIDHRTDIYACGHILHEMCTGRCVFDVTRGQNPDSHQASYDIMVRQVKEDPDLADRRVARLQPIIARCLRKEPSARYQTFHELQRDLCGLFSIPMAPPPEPVGSDQARRQAAPLMTMPDEPVSAPTPPPSADRGWLGGFFGKKR